VSSAENGCRTPHRTAFVRALLDLFPGFEGWVLVGVVVASAIAAVFETVGVAAVLPFMALVTDPSSLTRYPVVVDSLRIVGFDTPRDMLLGLGSATLVVVACGNAAAAANVVVQERFMAHTRTRLTSTLFAGYLRQPYAFHVRRDCPSILKVLVNDMAVVVNGVIAPFLMITSRGMVAFGILALLFVQDPTMSLTVGLLLGAAYAGVFWAASRSERRLGAEFNRLNLERQRVGQEALGGIKELQLLGRERFTLERYIRAAKGAADAEARNRTIAQLPRYGLEALAFGSILSALLMHVARGQSAQSLIPVLALFAFAGYRLLPALQYIYAAALSIRFAMPTLLSGIHDDFVHVAMAPNDQWIDDMEAPPMQFTSGIHLENITFQYENSAPVIKGLTLTIRPNESVGLVGRTGAGKSTLADLILGFYEPSEGRITVDGIPLESRTVRQWRRRVGYVPQQVFLANASISENIAFGLAPSEIDSEAVRKAAKLAQADEFISNLPGGYGAIIGERGVKLSGGQRQRLGIARALYADPELLVFDEATSALDGLTEDAVMEAIRALRGERTVILIAHRLRTVEACDQVVLLEQGRIIAQGPYAALIHSSPEFARFARSTPEVVPQP